MTWQRILNFLRKHKIQTRMDMLAYSQEIREQILNDQQTIQTLREQKYRSRFRWSGTNNHVYPIGMLQNRVYLALRSRIRPVHWPEVWILEDCCRFAEEVNQGTVMQPHDVTAYDYRGVKSVSEAVELSNQNKKHIRMTTSFCVGVKRRLLDKEVFSLLIEDLSAGGKYKFGGCSIQSFDTISPIKDSLVEVVFDIGVCDEGDHSFDLKQEAEMASLRYFHPDRIIDLEKV